MDWWFKVPCGPRCHREFGSERRACHSPGSHGPAQQAGVRVCVYVCVGMGGRGRVREGAMQLGLFVCFFFTLGSLAFEVLMSYVLVYRHVLEK